MCLKILKALFATVGFPKILRSDNSGEFTQEFTNGLLLLGIKHTTSSPLNSQSNGRAEQAVQKLRINLNNPPPHLRPTNAANIVKIQSNLITQIKIFIHLLSPSSNVGQTIRSQLYCPQK